MQRTSIAYRATDRFAPLVPDYLDGDPFFDPLIAFPFTRGGSERAAEARKFDPRSREVLCAALERQYAEVVVPLEVRRNLDALRKPGTLTITTGHQICLFTGPLYFPLKVLNTIRLARDSSTADRPVVPVFWMASEDHDRAEIDHAWLFGRKLHWPGESGAPVGRLMLDGIDAVLAELEPLLGAGEQADAMRVLLRAAYRPEHTLAQATRLFVNALFGRFGLVIIDGDDHDLKRLFAPAMKEEALHQAVRKGTAKADAILRQRYAPQAHAREINLFHLSDRLRARIEKKGDRYHVLDGGTEYSTEELLDTLDDRPQVFSPNVLMRPLFQETVLPNIAYVGGGGEVAYWLQLRPVFEHFGLPMPVVALRTSAMIIGEREQRSLSETGLSAEQLFRPIDRLRELVARAASAIDTGVDTEQLELEVFFDRLATRAKRVDPTLEASVRGEAQKASRSLEHIGQKLLRAAKRDQDQALQRLERLHAQLFPDGALMERRDNFIPLWLAQGPALFDALLDALDPLDKEFAILRM